MATEGRLVENRAFAVHSSVRQSLDRYTGGKPREVSGRIGTRTSLTIRREEPENEGLRNPRRLRSRLATSGRPGRAEAGAGRGAGEGPGGVAQLPRPARRQGRVQPQDEPAARPLLRRG